MPATSSEDPGVERPRGWMAALRAAAVGFLAVGLAAALLLHTAWGTRVLLTRIVASVLSLDQVRVEAATIGGSRVSSLRATGLRVYIGDSEPVVAVDSLTVRYRFLPLLRRAFTVRSATLVGPFVDLRECGLPAHGAVPPEGGPTDEAGGGWAVVLERLSLRGGRATGGECGDDGAWLVEGLDIEADQIRSAPSFEGRVGSLSSTIRPAGSPDDYRADLQFSGALTDGMLRVELATLRSPASDVSARGAVRPLDAPSGSSEIDFTLRADPLALRDLQPFTDRLAPEGSVRVEARLTSEGRRLEVDADLEVDGGGGAHLAATLAEADGSVLRYRGTGTLAELDPATVLRGAPPGAIDGAVDFDLLGPSLDRLSGSADVSVRRAPSEGGGGATMLADAAFSAGRAEASGFVESDQGRVSFQGWARPFEDRREGELSGDFSLRLDEASEARTDLSGDFDLAVTADGSGASGSGEVRLSGASIRSAVVPEAAVSFVFEGGRATWLASAAIDDGDLDAAGMLSLAGDPEIRIETGRVSDLDVAKLLGLSRRAMVNASFTGTRVGALSGLGSGTAQMVLGSSSLDSLTIDRGTIDLAFGDERIEARIQADAFSGSIEARLEGDLGDGGARVDVVQVVFADLDLSALPAAGSRLGPFTGSATGIWDGRTGGSGRFEIALQEGSFRRFVLDTATFAVRIGGDTVSVVGSVKPSRGEIRVKGSRTAATSGTSWLLEEADFEELDVGVFLESGELATRLTGRLEGSWTGPELSMGSGAAHLVLGSSVFEDRVVDSAWVTVDIQDGRSIWGAELDADQLAGRVDAALRFGGRADQIAGTVEFKGRVGGVDVDSALAVGRFGDGTLQADTLLLWSTDAHLAGRMSGVVRPGPARISDLSVLASFSGPELLRRWIAPNLTALQQAELTAVASTVGDSVQVSAEVSAAGATYGGAEAAALVGSGRGFLKPGEGLSGLRAQGEVSSVRAGGVPFERILIGAEAEADGLRLTSETVIDESRRARGTAWLHSREEVAELQVRSLAVDWGEQRWVLDGLPSFSFDRDVTVREFALASESGRISVDGVIGSSGPQRLQVAVQGVQLAGFSGAVGYENLRGALDGSLDLSGTAEAPTLTASLSTQGASIEGVPAAVNASIRFADRLLDVSTDLDFDSLGTGRVSGRIPVEFTLAAGDSSGMQWGVIDDGPIDLDVETGRLALSVLSAWLPSGSMRDVSGWIDADLRATGTSQALSLDGTVNVTGATALLPGLGIRPRDGRLAGRFEGDRLAIDLAEIYSGDGRITATGAVHTRDLAAGELDLVVAADDFLAVRSDLFRAVVDGNLTVGGTMAGPNVSGTVDVLSGDVYLGGRFAGTRAEVVELTEDDYAVLAERFGYEPPRGISTDRAGSASGLALNVDVRLGRDVWVRQRSNPALSVQFSGEARIEKAAGELERVYGTLEAVPRSSYVEQFGRRFAITSGTVVFAGLPTELRLDVRGEYTVPSRGDPSIAEVVIALGVVGGLNDLTLVLSSQPELENADIVSYLATGRPASQTLQFESPGGTRLVERGATMALGRATSAVERLASENMGLDVVQIRSEGGRGVTLVAGRYVSPRLYLGFKQPISYRRTDSSAATRTRSPELEIEYQAFRWLLLNLQRDGSRLDFFLRSRYAY